MKIVTLLFAGVALRSFAKVGAMNNGDKFDHSEMSTALRKSQPDIDAWLVHRHYHAMETENKDPNSKHPKNYIFLTGIVNGRPTTCNFLQGHLIPDSRVQSCNSPNGYATVDLHGSGRLYACIKPDLFFNKECVERERNGGAHVFLAHVYIEGSNLMEADLAPSKERSTLNSNGLLYHGEDFMKIEKAYPVGHVRYAKADQKNSIDVEGPLCIFPAGRRVHRT